MDLVKRSNDMVSPLACGRPAPLEMRRGTGARRRRCVPLGLACLLIILCTCQRIQPATALPPLEHLAAPATLVARITEPTPTLTSAPLRPDFGKLAYVLQGDVWTVTPNHPAPQQVTHGGRARSPRWSPSGRRIAYLCDLELRVFDTESGQDWPVGNPVSSFSWSPTDDRLVFVMGSGVLRLALIDFEKGQRTLLIPHERKEPGLIGRFVWHPDGGAIAYEWRHGLRDHGIWLIPSAGGEPRELYASGLPQAGEAVPAGWTPDGAYVLFWQGPEPSMSLYADGTALYALPASGGSPIALAEAVLLHPDFITAHPTRPTRLAVVTGGGRGTWSQKRIQVLDLPAAVSKVLTPDTLAAVSPAWSPDGRSLLYVAMPDRGDLVGGDPARRGLMARKLWMWTEADGVSRQLTDDEQYRDEAPRWSRDGRHILFARMEADGAASLWMLDAEDQSIWPVVDRLGPIPGPAESWFGFYGHVDWSAAFDWWQPPASGERETP